MHYDFEERRDDQNGRAYGPMYTADMYKEMVKDCPAGMKPLRPAGYADETWLSKNGSAADKPLVMQLAGLAYAKYNQVLFC